MTQRTMKIYGKTFGSTSTPRFLISLAGQTVFDRTVETTDSATLEEFHSDDVGNPLIVFDFPMQLSGAVPFSLYVEGCKFKWTVTLTNYHGNLTRVTDVDLANGTWPNGVPADKAEVIQDANSLEITDFLNKYGNVPESNFVIETTTVSADHWQDVNGENTVTSDGRDNLVINGVPKLLNVSLREQGIHMGDFHWTVEPGQTAVCDLVIAAAKDMPNAG